MQGPWSDLRPLGTLAGTIAVRQQQLCQSSMTLPAFEVVAIMERPMRKSSVGKGGQREQAPESLPML